MGRYYSGDIEGKFWFGVQASNAADRFGVIGEEPCYLTYCFDKEDLESVEDELKNIEETLGDKLQLITTFFNKCLTYTDDDIKSMGITNNDISEYADYRLGIKIRDCIKENSSCSFDAEL